MPRVSNINTLQDTSNNGCRCDCATPASRKTRDTRDTRLSPTPVPLVGRRRCKRFEEPLRSCFVLSSPIWEPAATGRRPPLRRSAVGPQAELAGPPRSFCFSPPPAFGGAGGPGPPPAAPRSAVGPQAELVGTPAPTPPD